MKYKDFKKTLDKYFNEDDQIYPHAGCNCVVFYKIFHGQKGFLIEKEAGDCPDVVDVESDLSRNK